MELFKCQPAPYAPYVLNFHNVLDQRLPINEKPIWGIGLMRKFNNGNRYLE